MSSIGRPEGLPRQQLPTARHYAISSLLWLPAFALRAMAPTFEFAHLACQPKLAERRLVGLSRFELLTPRLSSVCSNQLSYRPQGCLLEPRRFKEHRLRGRFSQN